jgi:predicted SAM-dependent methyltransferase
VAIAKRLNVGCGGKVQDGWINIDAHPLQGVDVVHDLDVFPWPFADAEASEILASHVFEHVRKPVDFVLECWRVLQPGGRLTIQCPHWTSENAFTDPTHLRFVTDRTFDYWCEGEALNGPLGAQFLGDVFKFRKVFKRRIGGDVIFRLEKIAA